MRSKVLLSLSLLLCFTGHIMVFAQTPVNLTVEQLYQLIDDHSRQIKLKALCLSDADEGISVARSAWLPQVNANLQLGYLGDGYLTDRDFSNGQHIDNPHFVNNFALEAMQLIYTGGAISQGIKMAELNKKLAALDLEQSRQQVRFVLLSNLIDLHCMHNRREVIEKNIEQTHQVLDNMHARFDEGVVLLSDITRYELQLASLELQLDKVNEAIKVDNYRLANALDYPLDTTFNPQLELIDGDYPIGSQKYWQQLAQDQSLGMQQAKLGIDMSETNVKLINSDRLPHIGAFVYGRMDSPIVTEVPVLNYNIMYWGFGVNVSYNISSLFTTNKKVRQAKVGVWESKERLDLVSEDLRNDVKAAYEAYQTGVTELRTQRKSVELSEQNYDIVYDRFENGMVLVTDMVDAANVKLSAQLGLQNALTGLLFDYYRLKYISNSL